MVDNQKVGPRNGITSKWRRTSRESHSSAEGAISAAH
jgi:hypothetical protein